jgi:hypothetical protein
MSLDGKEARNFYVLAAGGELQPRSKKMAGNPSPGDSGQIARFRQ